MSRNTGRNPPISGYRITPDQGPEPFSGVNNSQSAIPNLEPTTQSRFARCVFKICSGVFARSAFAFADAVSDRIPNLQSTDSINSGSTSVADHNVHCNVRASSSILVG